MNIAFVSWWGFHFGAGGIEAAAARVAVALREHGHHLCFVAREEFKPIEGIESLSLPDKRGVNTTPNREALLRFFGENNIDIIVSHFAYNRELSALLRYVADRIGAKLCIVLHTTPDYYKKERKDNKILNYLSALNRARRVLPILHSMHKCGDAVVLLSPRYIPIYQKIVGKPRARVLAIPNPNTYLTPRDPLVEKENIVVYVGRMAKEKKVDRVLQIWEKVHREFPEWRLELIGDGDQLEPLKHQAEALGLSHYTFYGAQDSRHYVERAKILLLTSDYEGWGLVITEALKMGTVPMSFNSYAALPEIVDDGRVGVMVEPYDLDAYAVALRALMTDGEKRERMSREGMEWVKRYDIESVVPMWEQLFNELTEK
ncbi:MAG: glycosyltransferase [Porphyromonas sp.]|nr:glycosyltransferase [Porphyromonas sp.]